MSKQGFKTSYEDFARAIEKCCTPESRDQIWPIYNYCGYEIVGSGDERHIRAVGPLEGEVWDHGAMGGRDLDQLIEQGYKETVAELEERLELYYPEEKESHLVKGRVCLKNELESEEMKDVRKDARENPKRWVPFRPLQRPGLLQEFADLYNQVLSEDDILEWVHEYGVLGLYGVPEERSEWPYHRLPSQGGPGETTRDFRHQVEEAWTVLISYEALTAGDKNGEPDVEAIREALEAPATLHSSEVIRRTTEHMESSLQHKLERHCYIRQYRYRDGWAVGYGFHSLLGAMYLQLAWLMQDARLPRTCKMPTCNELVVPKEEGGGRYQEFCSNGCKSRWHYHYRTKPRRQGRPPLA